MSSTGATGSMVQLNSRTPVTDFLTGSEGDEQLTFFKGESNCYAAFATNWVKLNFSATTMSQSVGETSTQAEVPRAGDMLCHAFMVFNAPAIANVSEDPITLSGAPSGGNKRVFVHTGDNSSRNSTMSLAAELAAGTITVALDLTGVISAGETVVVHDTAGLAFVRAVTSVTFDTDTVETEIAVAAMTAVGAAGTVQFAASSGALSSAASAAVFVDINYTPTLFANKTRASGPTSATSTVSATSTGILANVPILDRGLIHAQYGTYAPCAVMKELEVLIGTNPIAKVTGLVLQANCELWTASDRLSRRAVNKSDDPTERGAWALKRQTWVVPLPFWFNQGGYHSSLAMCALSFHSIVFSLILNPYTRAVLNGCGGDFAASTISVSGTGGSGNLLTTYAGPSSLNDGTSACDIVDHTIALAAPSTLLSGQQFSFYLLLELIYLSDDERDTYTDMTDEILIIQTQFASPLTLTASAQSGQMQLRFNHPVSHLVVAGQLQSNLNDNRWCDYEGPVQPFTVSQKYPEGMRNHWLRTMQLTFNNNPRTAEMPAWFFHETLPSVSAERIPDHHFYLYPFGLSSPNGSGQFSGGADFSRLDTAILNIVASPHVFSDMSSLGGLDAATTTAGANAITGGEKVIVQCFGLSANVGKYQSGLFGVCFM